MKSREVSQQSMLPFLKRFKSAVISTVDGEGDPFTSYAPYLYEGHHFYIFISDIATHAQNLRTQQRASLFFIEPEAEADDIFARKRLVLQCKSALISRDDEAFETLMQSFTGKFPMIAMLRQMQDFNLYRLTPFKGEATFGFGEAYTVGGELMQTLIPRSGGAGHRQSKTISLLESESEGR